MLSSTIQLSVRGKPSAFDLSCNNEMCVVASPGCLTFFLLSGLGSPRHVIHYEQPQQIRQIRYQKYGHLAALRGGVVSLWDPSKSLRPLLGFVHSTGWITDLDWNKSNHNILATSCDSGGGVSLWDMRSPRQSTMQISAGQVVTSIAWCPTNSDLLASCCDSQKVFVWDTRMAGSSTSASSTAGFSGSKNDSFVTINSSAGSVLSCCWSGKEETSSKLPSPSCQTLIIGKSNSTLEWWDINGISASTSANTANSVFNCSGPIDSQRVASISPVHLDDTTILLAAPYGKGVVVCRRLQGPDKSADSTAVQTADSIPSYVSTGLHDKQFPPADILFNGGSDSLPPGSSRDFKMDITLHGYPRYGLSLKEAFSPLSDDSDSSSERRSTLLASSYENILGVRWGSTTRLVPSALTGIEMMMLTDSAALHILRVPTKTLNERSQEDRMQRVSSSSSGQNSENVDKEMPGSERMKPKYALKKSLISHNSFIESHSNSLRQLPGNGKNSIPFRTTGTGLEVEVVHSSLTVDSSTGLGFESDPVKAELWSMLQREVLGLEERLQTGELESLTVVRVDQYARQITLEVRQKANQTSQAVYHPSQVSSSLGSHRSSIPVMPDYTATLIISFPAKYPALGSPSYAIRGSGMSVSAPHLSAELTAIMSARSSKLNASQRGSFPTQTHSDQGFLIELGKWFLTRVLQIWSQREVTGAALSIGIPPSDPNSPIRPPETLALILPGECKIESDPGAGIGGGIGIGVGVGVGGDSEVGMDVEGPLSLKSNGQAGGLGGGRDRGQDSGPSSCSGTFRLTDDAWAEIEEESDEGVPDADVIDPLAYRVPCPRSSGASFSALGVLVCFGGATLCLPPISGLGSGSERGRKVASSSASLPASLMAPMPYPKTLADLLVAERMRAEMLAVRASEEAEAIAAAAVEQELIAQRAHSGKGSSKGKGRRGKGRGGGRRGVRNNSYEGEYESDSGREMEGQGSSVGTHSTDIDSDADTDADTDASSDDSGDDYEEGSAVDNVRIFEEHLLSSAKMYDTAEQTKSFVYPPPTVQGPVIGQGAGGGVGVGAGAGAIGLIQGRGRGRVGKRGSPTTKNAQPFNPSSSLSTSSGNSSTQGQNVNQRGRTSMPDSTAYSTTALVSTVHKSGSIGVSNTAFSTGETPVTAVALASISRGGSTGDSPSPLLSSLSPKAVVLSAPTLSLPPTLTPTVVLPSALGLSNSLLFPLAHPQDTLDTLGVTLDQQDDVIASAANQTHGHAHGHAYGHGTEGYNGYDEYGGHVEEEDEEEEGAERGSIAMSNKPFRIKLYHAANERAQLLAFHYILGPLSCGHLDDLPSVWAARAAACRHNATALETVEKILHVRRMRGRGRAAGGQGESGSLGRIWPTPSSGRVGCHGQVRVVQQLWSLMASSIEVMAHTKSGCRTDCVAVVEKGVGDKGDVKKKGEKEKAAPRSAPDSMPMGDGSEVNWSESVLGRSLLCRCVDQLRKNGDLQTLATVVCIFGGGVELVSLMTPASHNCRSVSTASFTVRDVEQLLGAYSEMLRQWSSILQATEVAKRMQPDCFSHSTLSSSLSLATVSVPHPVSVPSLAQPVKKRSFSGSREVAQGEEIPVQDPVQLQLQLQLQGAVNRHDLEVTRDFVTLVRLGVNCPRCGTATDTDAPYSSQVSDAPYRSQRVVSPLGDKQAAVVSDSSDIERDRGNIGNMAGEMVSINRKELTRSKGHENGNAVWCRPCKDYALTCSLCQMPIRGAGYFCSACGHGGHTAHMRQWFEITVECAAGCGCKCGELAEVGHGLGFRSKGRGKYTADRTDGTDHRGDSTGRSSSSTSSPYAESLSGFRGAVDKEATHDKQTAGNDYFLYNSDSNSVSSEEQASASDSSDSDMDSEYDSEDAEGDSDAQSGSNDDDHDDHRDGGERSRAGRDDQDVDRDGDSDSYNPFGQGWDHD